MLPRHLRFGNHVYICIEMILRNDTENHDFINCLWLSLLIWVCAPKRWTGSAAQKEARCAHPMLYVPVAGI